MRMKLARLRSGASLGPLALVCLLAGEHSALAADHVWKVTPPPGAQFSCQGVTQVCIALHTVLVKKTPNDAGAWEEWALRLRTDPGSVSMPKQISVKDKYSGPGLEYPISLHFCLPAQLAAFELSVTGHEDDMWPNPDDSIPHTKIQVVNECAHAPTHKDTVAGRYLTACKNDSDGDREACYSFEGEYR